MQKHLNEECEITAQSECPKQCGEHITPAKLQHHLKQECMKRIVKCGHYFCHEEMEATLLAPHMQDAAFHNENFMKFCVNLGDHFHDFKGWNDTANRSLEP